jgi:hypothetical protein
MRRFNTAYLAARALKFCNLFATKIANRSVNLNIKVARMRLKFSGAKSALWARSTKRKPKLQRVALNFKILMRQRVISVPRSRQPYK